MKSFTDLSLDLERACNDSEKIDSLKHYFSAISPARAAWAIFFLSGRRLATGLKTSKLRAWAQQYAGVSDWLFEECYETAADLGETVALILPPTEAPQDVSLDLLVEETLTVLKGASDEQQCRLITDAWRSLDQAQRFLFNKLATGSFRPPVSAQILVRAISELSGLDASVTARRLANDWKPSDGFYLELCQPESGGSPSLRAYPFLLAPALDGAELRELLELTASSDWLAEWMWDGIRAQLTKRGGSVSIWSRDEELLTPRLPDLVKGAAGLPDGVVLDGEILAWKDSDVIPFQMLQKRLGRSKPTAGIQKEIPVVFMAHDLLEENGCDIRNLPIEYRLERLRDVLSSRNRVGSDAQFEQLKLFAPCQIQLNPVLKCSPALPADSWKALEALRVEARRMKVKGLILKRRGSFYGSGRHKGDWWKWKIDPLKLDAVLVAAQPGSGEQAGLFCDFSFALWQGGELLSFARAQSGLSEAEILEIDAFVRENTLARYGPVRNVKPALVFELGFETIHASQRYKSGIAAKGCRVLQWRHDKPADKADLLKTAKMMMV